MAHSGYIEVWTPAGYAYEHRLVMAEHLGRDLLSTEQVHHINGDKADNRIENLRILSQSDHAAEHHAEIHRLRARVADLEAMLGAQAKAP